MKESSNRRPTLMDVGRLAGVSLCSASRALSAPDDVRPATREKGQRAVLQLGYIRNGAARALVSRRTSTVAAIYPSLNNPVFAHSTEAMQHALWRRGYQLIIASHNYHIDDEPAVIRSVVERCVDGLIMVGTDRSEDIYKLLRQRTCRTSILGPWTRPSIPIASAYRTSGRCMT